MIDLKQAARGRWRAILPSFGIDVRFLTGKHGPCPMCEGTDRWRFDDKDGGGTWFCTHCGAGDGVKLVMLKTGLEFKDAAKEIAKIAGTAVAEKRKTETSTEEKRRVMNEVWRLSSSLGQESPAAAYLRRRGLYGLDITGELRSTARALYKDRDGSTFWPAMLARVRDAAGKPVNVYRTYLTEDGRKAPVEDVKRMMAGTMPAGAAVRLFPLAERMGIAEGIETGSVGRVHVRRGDLGRARRCAAANLEPAAGRAERGDLRGPRPDLRRPERVLRSSQAAERS